MCVGLALLSLVFCSIEPFKETGEIFLLQEITFNALLEVNRMCAVAVGLCSFPLIFLSLLTPVNTHFYDHGFISVLSQVALRPLTLPSSLLFWPFWHLCTSTWVSGPRPRCHSLPYDFSWNHADFVDQSGQGCHLTAMNFLRSVSGNSLSPSRIWHHKQHRILLTPGVDSNRRQAVLSCHLMYPSSDTMHLEQCQVP